MRVLLLSGLSILWFTTDLRAIADKDESDIRAKLKEQTERLRSTTDSKEQRQLRDEIREEIQKLGSYGTPAVAPLSEALRDSNADVRHAAAWAFGRMETAVVTKALPILIEAMRSEKDEQVLEGLAKTIAHAKEAAVPGLIDLARTARAEVRQMAFYSLGRLHGAAKSAVPALIELLGDKDGEVCGGAVYVLGRIGPDARSAVPALVKVAASSREGVADVIKALAAIGEASDETLALVLKALKDADPKIRTAAVRACAAFGPRSKAAVPDLIRLLDDSKVNSSDSYPRPVVYALGRVGPDAKAAGPKLMALLKDSDIEHASHAAAALLGIGIEEKAAVATFNRALDKSLQPEQAHIRFRTLEVLEHMGPAARPVVPLLQVIQRDESDDEDIRFSAGRVLKKIDATAREKPK